MYAQAAQQRCADENDPVNASANASDLVGIGVCVTNASVIRSGRPQAVSNSDRFYNFYSLYNTVEIPL